jgi:hypothetical protein
MDKAKLILAALCAGTVMAALTVAANPFGGHSERGTIQNIDPQQNTLTVRDAHEGSTHGYVWNQDTKFLQQQGTWRSRAITSADLKQGEQVNILYRREGDRSLARKVVVVTRHSQTSRSRATAESQS